jgi:H+/Cl- antiporter ClcA
VEQFGKVLIGLGIILVIAGVIVYFAGNRLNWFGNLPGDIKIVKENVRVYFPITTMILLSIVISVIFYLLRKFF